MSRFLQFYYRVLHIFTCLYQLFLKDTQFIMHIFKIKIGELVKAMKGTEMMN